MYSMAANFKKKRPCASSSRNPSVPAGSKVSIGNNQLLVSCGVPSLDNILGGGIPVGSLLLIEEDVHSTFSNILLRYFMAEGVLNGHGLLLACSCDGKANGILKKLPAPVDEDLENLGTAGESAASNAAKDGGDELKIAWRYKYLPSKEMPGKGAKFGNYFDLSKVMDQSSFSGLFVKTILPTNSAMDTSKQISSKITHSYRNMLQQIKHILKDYSIHSSTPGKSILRLAIESFGSPLWQEYTSLHEIMASLSWFLLALKSLLRTSFGVCIVTIPVHLFQDAACTRRLEQCVDHAVQLESFAGSKNDKNPAFKDYNGLIHIKKKSRINSLIGHDIDTSDWAFKLKRKKFCIEKLHLPPDLSETVSRTQNDSKRTQVGERKLCSLSGSNTSKLLDF